MKVDNFNVMIYDLAGLRSTTFLVKRERFGEVCVLSECNTQEGNFIEFARFIIPFDGNYPVEVDAKGRERFVKVYGV